tara:strand:- start:10914 stop:11204 length:291 start_codon:yes stop_codon:yes gene_type:complete
MKNVTLAGWTRDTSGYKETVYTHQPDADTLITVSFDDIIGDFEAAVSDMGGYENDMRVKMQGKFNNTPEHIKQILNAAQSLRLRDDADPAAFKAAA